MKYTVLILFLLFFIAACEKLDYRTVTVSGRIVHDSDKSAYGNAKFLVYQEYAKQIGGKRLGYNKEFHTDSNGYFRVDYMPNDPGGYICYPDVPSTNEKHTLANFIVTDDAAYNLGTIYTDR